MYTDFSDIKEKACLQLSTGSKRQKEPQSAQHSPNIASKWHQQSLKKTPRRPRRNEPSVLSTSRPF